MKDKILQLRKDGKSFREISKILGCSKSTINYHCSSEGKSKVLRRRIKNVKTNIQFLRDSLGGKCKFCSYSRCPEALEFHHLDSSTKDRKYRGVSEMLRNCSKQKALEEIKKCILLCCICHREYHFGIRDINGNFI